MSSINICHPSGMEESRSKASVFVFAIIGLHFLARSLFLYMTVYIYISHSAALIYGSHPLVQINETKWSVDPLVNRIERSGLLDFAELWKALSSALITVLRNWYLFRIEIIRFRGRPTQKQQARGQKTGSKKENRSAIIEGDSQHIPIYSVCRFV